MYRLDSQLYPSLGDNLSDPVQPADDKGISFRYGESVRSTGRDRDLFRPQGLC